MPTGYGIGRSSVHRMNEPAFDADTLARLRDEQEVRIETRGPEDEVHRTIIWVVVDAADRVLIRSYRGAGARWYREAVGTGTAELVIDEMTIKVRIEHAADPERVTACSAELERKYAGDPATPAMVADEVLETTLELLPG
ncbi:hypothetical protein BH24CHL10_BH24CHL10_02130 [soil metagenome]